MTPQSCELPAGVTRPLCQQVQGVGNAHSAGDGLPSCPVMSSNSIEGCHARLGTPSCRCAQTGFEAFFLAALASLMMRGGSCSAGCCMAEI